jgi:hypothetical protein
MSTKVRLKYKFNSEYVTTHDYYPKLDWSNKRKSLMKWRKYLTIERKELERKELIKRKSKQLNV